MSKYSVKDLLDVDPEENLARFEKLQKMLDEMNTTASVGGSYNTPNAFTKDGEENDDEENYKYYDKVEENFNQSTLRDYFSHSKDLKEAVELGQYNSREDLTPEQKIGKTLKQTKKVFKKLQKEIRKTVKTKNENGMSNDRLWKSSKKDLKEINSMLLNMTRMMREISS